MAVYKCAGKDRFDDDGVPFCDYESDRYWRGRCPGCGRCYDPIKVGSDRKEKRVTAATAAARGEINYISTGTDHVDYVLSGGLVKGSIILFGGERGSGKSSLTLTICDGVQKLTKKPILYASGEQSNDQLGQICRRVEVINDNIELMGSTRNVFDVLAKCEELKPVVAAFDSLQAMTPHGGIVATSTDNVVAAKAVHEHCEKTGMCAIVINHLNAQLEYKGGTDAPHLVETEMLLHRFVEGNEAGADGDPWALFGDADESEMSTLRRRRRERAGEGIEQRVNIAKVRTLLVRKNRNGEEMRKVFFEMSDTGQLKPLQHNKPKF